MNISSETWILLTGIVVAASCALIGNFLVVRRMAMLGDALSHSVLLGLVGAFLLTGNRGAGAMFLGAIVTGLLTAYLSDFLNKRGRLKEDASIGVVFTTLFAIAVILISVYADKVDFDQDCVLHGEIAFTPLDTIAPFGVDIGPRAFWIALLSLVINVVFIAVCWRRISLVSFDPMLANALGISAQRWHYILMTFVSLTVVTSFEVVVAILVVAMLVIPANTAAFLTGRLLPMIALSLVFAVLSAYLGVEVAAVYDASISASICLAGAALFLSVLIFRHVRRIMPHSNVTD